MIVATISVNVYKVIAAILKFFHASHLNLKQVFVTYNYYGHFYRCYRNTEGAKGQSGWLLSQQSVEVKARQAANGPADLLTFRHHKKPPAKEYKQTQVEDTYFKYPSLAYQNFL